jgi:tripartite ATP-independent transporter DctP family solute receptor
MTYSRRKFIRASTAAALLMPRPAHSQAFSARQYHSQPKDSHLQLYLTKIWDAVREETGGRLNVTVYPRNNGATVGDPEIFTQLQSGKLELFALNGNILSQAAPAPAADIQGIPFAFSSSQQVAALNDGEFGDYLRRELVSKDIQLIPFGGMENGFKQITSVDRPIQKADDLHGFKMRVPNGKLFVDFYDALGAAPKIVDFNRLNQALAAHEVDGQENPLIDAEDNKLYEVCRYVGLTSHEWAGYNMLANQTFWQRLPQDIRDSIVRNTQKFVPQQRAFVQALNASAENKLRDRRMIFVQVDTESFRKTLTKVGFYRKWRASCGEEAWALMEAQTGPVG